MFLFNAQLDSLEQHASLVSEDTTLVTGSCDCFPALNIVFRKSASERCTLGSIYPGSDN